MFVTMCIMIIGSHLMLSCSVCLKTYLHVISAAELNNVHATGCLAAIIKYLDVSKQRLDILLLFVTV